MISGTLSYSDLKITPSDLYVQMGYGDSIPDEMTLREAESVLNEIKFWLNAQYCFIDSYFNSCFNCLLNIVSLFQMESWTKAAPLSSLWAESTESVGS